MLILPLRLISICLYVPNCLSPLLFLHIILFNTSMGIACPRVWVLHDPNDIVFFYQG